MKRLGTLIRRNILTVPSLLVVSAVAGLISYNHITGLSLVLGQTSLDSHLMAFGVDGLIVMGSTVVLAGNWLGWLGIVPGIVVSVFANVEAGMPHGHLAAVWSGVPAVSFAIAMFILERHVVKSRKTVPHAHHILGDAVLTLAQGNRVLEENHLKIRDAALAVGKSDLAIRLLSDPDEIPVQSSVPRRSRSSAPEPENLLETLKSEFAEILKENRAPRVQEIKDRMKIGATKAMRYRNLIVTELLDA